MRIFLGVTIFGLFLVGIGAAPASSQELRGNEEMVAAAWSAFNAKDYEGAMSRAEECIDEFEAAAKREQEKLAKAGTPEPPEGKVVDSARDEILERGLLNDVATSFFILGRSAEYLGRRGQAGKAYTQCAELTYARTWDPQGWFWNPSQTCKDRLPKVRQ